MPNFYIQLILLCCVVFSLGSCREPSEQETTYVQTSPPKNKILSHQTAIKEDSHPLTFVYSSDLQGELEPCGCTPESDYGGILRRAAVLKQLRQQSPDLLLISAGGLLDIESSTQKIKNTYLLKAFANLNYDALNLQWRDLAFGPSFLSIEGLKNESLENEKIPWLSSNAPYSDTVVSDKAVSDKVFSKSIKVQRGGQQIQFWGLLNPAGASLDHYRLQAQQKLAKLQSKNTQVKSVRKPIKVLMLGEAMANYSGDQAPEDWLAAFNIHFDIVIEPTDQPEFAEPRWLGKTLILGPGHRGMRLGLLNLSVSYEPTGIKTLEVVDHQVIPLDNQVQVEDAADWLRWYESYNEAVKLDFEQEIALMKTRRQGESPLASAKACKTCHAKAYDQWQSSKHSSALSVLKKKHKAFDPECLQCHVVGLGEEGGYLSEELTPELANVQCENCHGARRDHIKNPTQFKGSMIEDPKSICLECHNATHSPNFEFERYWPHVEHF